MRILPFLLLLLLLGCRSATQVAVQSPPTAPPQNRPWTRWWWMGSAVDKENITYQLEQFREAGIGGVEITPIYGVKGWENKNIPYLSPAWMEMLRYTCAEAGRLGLGVDLNHGTGWPFGGPHITKAQAAKKQVLKKYELANRTELNRLLAKMPGSGSPDTSFIALTFYPNQGEPVHLKRPESLQDQNLLQAVTFPARAYVLLLTPTQQRVKRAAPGGEGLVLDHFSAEALATYLSRTEEAFTSSGGSPPIRAFFNDSYEVYGADWTPGFAERFLEMREYDLTDHLEALAGEGDPEVAARVKADYRLTISELLLQDFTHPWRDWAHRHNALVRNQAHGSPGNLIDLYAAVDIPETEIFRYSQFELPGLGLEGLPKVPDEPSFFMMKFASSAAHLTGKQLVSSETFTWLRDHFQTALYQGKAEVDKLFTAGINHLFFHGSTYSPREEMWPGWLFYASSHFNPANAWWRDLKYFNSYLTEVQRHLQGSRSDHDVLLYWPVSDLWSGVYPEIDQQLFSAFTMHNLDQWLYPTSFYGAGEWLEERGYSYDYISDDLLQKADVGKEIRVLNSRYRAIVVPACRYIPFETMQALLELERKGATVIYLDKVPESVFGFKTFQEKQGIFEYLKERHPFKHVLPAPDREELTLLLAKAGVRREAMGQQGLQYIRKKNPEGYVYFLTNLSAREVNEWVPLGVAAKGGLLLDPMHGKQGVAALRQGNGGQPEVLLQLQPGESRLLTTSASSFAGPAWRYREQVGEPEALTGEWRLQFLEGGPALPPERQLPELISWTELGDSTARFFSGTAAYTLTFDKPQSAAEGWTLAFDQVAASARVWLNGQEVGSLVALPWRLDLPDRLLRRRNNTLRVEVTNLDANRIIHQDRTDPSWKKFTDANIVNIDYKPFDASRNQPLPSGLIGEVRLVPVRYRK
ncbi:glycosyl hydrolase [soil metagenome]